MEDLLSVLFSSALSRGMTLIRSVGGCWLFSLVLCVNRDSDNYCGWR